MQLRWTLQDLVEEVAAQLAVVPSQRNGQVRAVPDERTVRYYGTIGLLDGPIEMRGRTALYGRKHIAQVVAIKRLQAMGRSLAEIQAMWPTLTDAKLAEISGVAFTGADPLLSGRLPSRIDAVSREVGPPSAKPVDRVAAASAPSGAGPSREAAPVAVAAPVAIAAPVAAAAPVVLAALPGGAAGEIELRVELAPNVVLSVALVDDRVAISPADVRALRAAAAPLVAELTSRLRASAGQAKR